MLSLEAGILRNVCREPYCINASLSGAGSFRLRDILCLLLPGLPLLEDDGGCWCRLTALW